VEARLPGVRDRSGSGIVFNSALLPPYLKRAKNVEEFPPWLYLKGVSTGGYGEALESLLGENAKGLSANTIFWRTRIPSTGSRSGAPFTNTPAGTASPPSAAASSSRPSPKKGSKTSSGFKARDRMENEFRAYDITSISSCSECLRQVLYGNNKENDRLRRLNLALVFGESSGLPFYYRKMAGNIPDVKTVKLLLSELDILGYSKVKLVMEQRVLQRGQPQRPLQGACQVPDRGEDVPVLRQAESGTHIPWIPGIIYLGIDLNPWYD